MAFPSARVTGSPAMSAEPLFSNVSRIEIIGPGGRELVAYYEPGVVLDLQDEGRTIKLFVGERAKRA